MWEIFRLFPSCHKGSSLSVLIQSHIITDYFCNPQKASVGMYSSIRLSLVCILFDPAIPTSFFNFIQLFFILVSVLFLLYLVQFISAILSQLLSSVIISGSLKGGIRIPSHAPH